jgi:hypothetical protein
MERAFYIVIARLFWEKDILQPMLRQALCSLFDVQKLDVELSLRPKPSRRRNLAVLKNCGRDRSGHAITVLTLLLVPGLPLAKHHVLYQTGCLISYIDDYGDFYFDRALGKATYINRVRAPKKFLRQTFDATTALVDRELNDSPGRDLLKAFLHRYFTTRLRKHQTERLREDKARPVYE